MRRSEYGITGHGCGALSSETSPGESLVTHPSMALAEELNSKAYSKNSLLSSMLIQVGGTAIHMGISCLVCQCKPPPSILTTLARLLVIISASCISTCLWSLTRGCFSRDGTRCSLSATR